MGRDTRPKVGLISLGCSKNLIDSEVMLGHVARDGFTVTGDIGEADVVVVNTCTFIDEAKRESIDTILEIAELKKKGRLKGVVVTGCMAQRYPEEIRKEIPDVDGIVGLTAEDEMSAVIGRILGGDGGARSTGGRQKAQVPGTGTRHGHGHGHGQGKPLKTLPMAPKKGPIVLVRDPSRPFGAEVGRLRLTPRHYAYLRVAEGCDHLCTFCAIPSFRGKFRSKPEDAVLEEARELAGDGAVELNLIAEDTNQYGQDRRDGSTLARLLEKLAAIDGVRWIRILYAYPAYFPDALVRAMASIDKVVKYVDIPLQHIADPVLARMRRPPRGRTVDLLERLRAGIPGLALRTTFICGFPGETERDHEELVSFVRDFRFERLGAFAYSPEDGTPAHDLDGQLQDGERRARRDRVMAVQQEVAFARAKAQVGRPVEALVEGEDEHGRIVARTGSDAPEIDPVLLLAPPPAPGRGRRPPPPPAPGTFVRARVTGASGYDLVGELG